LQKNKEKGLLQSSGSDISLHKRIVVPLGHEGMDNIKFWSCMLNIDYWTFFSSTFQSTQSTNYELSTFKVSSIKYQVSNAIFNI